MPKYVAFGGLLSSELGFDELPVADIGGEPDWSLRISSVAPPGSSGQPLGEDTVYGAVKVRSLTSGEGVRLAYDDTGTFDVAGDGRSITWYPPEGPRPEEAVRADVIGRVLAIAMHMQGVFTLHASAVAPRPGVGIALLAPKGFGKSTLAAALLRGGARLLSDDAAPVRVPAEGPALLSPGIHQVRLWGDSAERVGLGATSAEGRKVVVTTFDEEQVTRAPVAFDAAYVLRPTAPDPGAPPVERIRLGEIDGAMALVEQAKVGALLGGREGPAFFEMAMSVARRVPVYALAVMRDLSRLDDVAQTVLGWHGYPPHA
ncbi:MAG: hypothetical protein JNJ98_10205 [Gemmatimonadetes bacterium]|nr:hypothetical protein [Gemmatimonadota bacterium]